MERKRLIRFFIAFIPMIISLGVLLFYHSDRKADIYLFYEHKRYLDNIFYDISNLLAFTIFSFYASRYDKKTFFPFFILSLIEILGYFLFYKQFITLISLPILVILIIIYNNK